MDGADYTEKSPGRRVQITRPDSGWAFIPDSLPPAIDWSSGELWQLLSDADRAIGRLAGVGQMIPNPYLLISPLRRREAILSSRIEGTQAGASELVLFELHQPSHGHAGDVREVHNYIRALDKGLERVQRVPISLNLLRELHQILLDGVRGQRTRPGEFRREQNWIGTEHSPITEARYVPPPPSEMMQCLYDLERFINSPPPSLPPLVRIALVHYQFEAIHPFLDGNGRLGRLLISLQLKVEGILPEPLLYLSAYFERHRQAYYDHLLAVSTQGHWDQWLTFFLRGVASEANDATARAGRLIELRTGYQTRFQRARSSALTQRLCDALFVSPAVNTATVCSILGGVTHQTAMSHIRRLVNAGILTEVTGQARNQVWVASEILGIIEDMT